VQPAERLVRPVPLVDRLTYPGRMALDFLLKRNDQAVADEPRSQILADPGFGKSFTDHMVTVTWTPSQGWHDARVGPYAPLVLDPSAAVLHYGQEIFEGLKAYRHPDGSVWAFRPDRNAARFAGSARRLALPELPAEDFLGSVRALVAADIDWVPDQRDGEKSLYLRPFMFASEAFLGVRPAARVTYCVIASPAGPYFAGGVRPVSIWLSQDYTRAAPGGTGAAKCGGNYAASLAAQLEAIERGCDQVCFLDAVEHRWVEELGGMNLFFVLDDGGVVTPQTDGTILAGVTRDSVIELLREAGHQVSERRVDVAEWRDGAASGRVREVFACGTAAVITPIGRLAWPDGEASVGGDAIGPVTASVRQTLVDLQYGRAEDTRGWMHPLA
jgi:branched-chain amino acid aminotransferase